MTQGPLYIAPVGQLISWTSPTDGVVNPHGDTITHICSGCYLHRATYQGRFPRRWAILHGRPYCPRCKRARRRT